MEPAVEERLQKAVVELSEALEQAGDEGMPYLLSALAKAAEANGEELPPFLGMLLGVD